MADLEPFPESWGRAVAVVAHPDDMEYGAAAAVARWTAAGKDIRYVLVTSGEAGIATMTPDECQPIREGEQKASCAAVGVEQLEFLGFRDGMVEAGLDLRRALAGVIRRHRPDIVLSCNYRDTWGGPSWNHADHRAVGVSLLDAVRDAANPWIFTDQGEAWEGTQFVAFNGSPQPTHWVDVDATIDDGIASLRCHEVYLSALDGPGDPTAFLRTNAQEAAAGLPVDHAATFELVLG